MRYIFHFVLAWCLLCGFLASVQAYNGNQLLEGCTAYLDKNFVGKVEDTVAVGICVGYLTGVLDALDTWQASEGRRVVCLPKPWDINQIVRIVVKYLENNPEDLHYRADAAVLFAVKAAFPCTEGEQ